jgi:uncharacterized protein YutE (UPF0331/DUF86 family)
MVDRQLLQEKLKLLAEYIADLQNESSTTLQEIKQNKKQRRYIERTLHLAVESCLDIGSHIISDLGLREPEDNKDIIAVLTESGYLPENMLSNLQKMAQFRNVIVHDYARIDPEILYSILNKNLSDLIFFARTIRDNFLQ